MGGTWTRIKRSGWYQRRKRFLKRLAGEELKLAVERRVPLERVGDWWYAPEGLAEGRLVYSLGVGDDVGFDLALIERHGVEVHAFDPTPSTIAMLDGRELPARFRFHPWAVGAADGSLTFYPRLKRDGTKSDVMFTLVAEEATRGDGIDVPCFTLASIVERLGHGPIELLKMDVEGAEYDVLDGMLDAGILPRQLLVEYHHRFPGIGVERTAASIERLRAAGYRIVAISDIGREVSFLRD